MALLPEIVRRAVKVRLAERLPFAKRRMGPQIPSGSLYFADPLADLISNRNDNPERPIRRLGRNLYVSGGRAVIIRYAGPADLRMLEQNGYERVYLVVDDDFFALAENDGLPADYRRRLIAYRDGPLQQLLRHVTDVVAPSNIILRAYRRKRAIQLDPAQCHRAGALVHHNRAKPFDVVFAATRSHLLDLNHIAEALAEFLQLRPEARLTTFLNGHAPRPLRSLPNAIHLPMMDWHRYRIFVAENRFHAAIAPALDTAFNRARSISRLHDHAAFGAAGLYTRQPPFAGIVADGQSGMLLPNDPQAWRDGLLNLVANRGLARSLASGGQVLSQTLGDMRRVRNFWLKELELV
ncbi:MAG: hypothetical protein KDK89_00530 [Alphaproteobacteria bacterium]|nr:hypothetical protein [Alphaproteobacteria bacterium]